LAADGGNEELKTHPKIPGRSTHQQKKAGVKTGLSEMSRTGGGISISA
jgi:hypothetical protein